MQSRKEWNEHIHKKQKERKIEEELELRNLKNSNEVWEYINKKRKRKEDITNRITKEEWKYHFLKLLDGKEEEEKEGQSMENTEEGREEMKRKEKDIGQDIEEEEIITAMKRMKMKKAPGIEGIPMEAWCHKGTTVRKGLVELIKQVWSENTIPKDWKISVVAPIYKKGDQDRTGNYRSISLLCTAYKVYAEVLRRRLEEEWRR